MRMPHRACRRSQLAAKAGREHAGICEAGPSGSKTETSQQALLSALLPSWFFHAVLVASGLSGVLISGTQAIVQRALSATRGARGHQVARGHVAGGST